MATASEAKPLETGPAASPPGIVIRDVGVPAVTPSIVAFIWGGKTRPVPAIPYGRRTA